MHHDVVEVDQHPTPLGFTLAPNRLGAEVMQICDIFRAKIIDVQPRNVAIEITGNESKIEKFLFLMEPFGIRDLTRTGKVAVRRSE